MTPTYDMAFPDPTRESRVLTLCGVVGLDPSVFDQLRDAWVEKVDAELRAAFYARMGGHRRETYRAVIGYLRNHPGFVSDRDDDLDSTYTTFRYQIPPSLPLMPGLHEVLRSNAHDGEVNSDQRWERAFLLTALRENFGGEDFGGEDGAIVIPI